MNKFVLLFGFLIHGIYAQSPPRVEVRNGTIEGFKCVESDVNAYLGIPYAAPPTGGLRFEPPQTYNDSYPGGTFNATKPPPACIQFGNEFIEDPPWSEDCLFLDVWAPQGATRRSGLPVLFWIYGGAFTAGGISNPLYGGCSLAFDAIVVSANYRLGPLGYLALQDVGVGGNMGFQDIILALNWVQENIAAFGGDPEKVAVFGQSAGAITTWILSTLPESNSLMRAAITESGAGQWPPSSYNAETASMNYAKILRCNISDIACFRAKSPSELNASYPASGGLSVQSSTTRLMPYVDGHIIPKVPTLVGSKIPLLAGTNTQETTLFDLPAYPDPSNLTSANYTYAIKTNYGKASSEILSQYPFSTFSNDPLPAFDGIVEVGTLSAFTCPNYNALQSTIKAGVPAWTYLYNHTDTCPWYPWVKTSDLEILGAAHTSEIAFAFNHTTKLPGLNGTCEFTAQEVAISHAMAASWKSMAMNGNPGANLGNNLGSWPPYNESSSLGLIINNVTSIGYINYTGCAFWNELESSSSSSSNGSTSTNGTSTASSGANALGMKFRWMCAVVSVFTVLIVL